jgi:hypothetical protein
MNGVERPEIPGLEHGRGGQHLRVDLHERDTGQDVVRPAKLRGAGARPQEGTQDFHASERARDAIRPRLEQSEQRTRLGLPRHQLHDG